MEEFSFQHGLIRSNTFIRFWENFLPTCLFGADIQDSHVGNLTKKYHFLYKNLYTKHSDFNSKLPPMLTIASISLNYTFIRCFTKKSYLHVYLIFKKFPSNTFIWHYTFIRFCEIFLPTCLLGLHAY